MRSIADHAAPQSRDPGLAAHHAAKGGALRCIRGTSSLRGALATKQSSLTVEPLDCFAALAMTESLRDQPRSSQASVVMGPRVREDDSGVGGTTSSPHPLLRLLVFCTRLPCSPCSRMLCFSSSRWLLVVSSGILGSLPGPLWLLLSSGTGGMVLVMRGLLWLADNAGRGARVPVSAPPFIIITF